jgi:hypothetical protein
MSTYRGIAVVTQTLQYVLSTAAAAVPNATVRIGPPEDARPAGGPVVNLYLYSVRPTAATRNESLPTRDHAGKLLQEPTIGVELDYVISFTGERNTVEAELLLGSVMLALEVSPILTRDQITAAISASGVSSLSADDLAEPIGVVALALTSEERSKLWSVFFQVPYRLSMEYRASTTLLAADLPLDPRPEPPTEVRPSIVPTSDRSSDTAAPNTSDRKRRRWGRG